jgi:hypothetical protein
MGESGYPGGYFLAMVNNDTGRYSWKLIPFMLIWAAFSIVLVVSVTTLDPYRGRN